jgi:AcrR family transcriptional regulator
MALFAADGFDQTSVRGIAEKCGLTDAALYYYYPNKRAILNALWDVPQAHALRAFVPGLHLTEQRLVQLVDAMLDGAAEHDALVRLMVRGVLDGDRTALALRNQTMAYWRSYLMPHFETCFTREEAALRVDALVMIIIGATFGGQIDNPGGFPRLCRSRAYREHVRTLVLSSIPLDGCGQTG